MTHGNQPRWIHHNRLLHAFVMDDPPTFPVKSACGYHQIADGERSTIGAAQCIECAVALGQETPEPQSLRWVHNGPQKMGCQYCRPTEVRPDDVGTTTAGLIAPQSAIDAMQRKNR